LNGKNKVIYVDGVVGGGETLNSVTKDHRVNIPVRKSRQTQKSIETRTHTLVDSTPKSARKHELKATSPLKFHDSPVNSPGRPRRKTLASLVSINSVSTISLTSKVR
jgi:hypothetical protein